MTTEKSDAVRYEPVTYQPVPRDTSAERFIELWLHDRPPLTQEAYRREAYRFLLFLGDDTPLDRVRLADMQDFADSLAYLKPASKARALKAIKSLYSFGGKTGYLHYNVGALVRLPKTQRKLAQRILSEEQVQKMLAMESDQRNHTLLRFLYVSGARVSETCALTWRDFADRENGLGQVTFNGKGEKERTVLLPASLYQEVRRLRNGRGEDAPVFLSQKHGHLDPSQVHRIVETAAVRAKVLISVETMARKNRKTKQIDVRRVVKSRVSPHFLRHAHVSHALDRGVPPHVVQQTVGHASLATTSEYSHARPDTSSALKLG